MIVSGLIVVELESGDELKVAVRPVTLVKLERHFGVAAASLFRPVRFEALCWLAHQEILARRGKGEMQDGPSIPAGFDAFLELVVDVSREVPDEDPTEAADPPPSDGSPA